MHDVGCRYEADVQIHSGTLTDAIDTYGVESEASLADVSATMTVSDRTGQLPTVQCEYTFSLVLAVNSYADSDEVFVEGVRVNSNPSCVS